MDNLIQMLAGFSGERGGFGLRGLGALSAEQRYKTQCTIGLANIVPFYEEVSACFTLASAADREQHALGIDTHYVEQFDSLVRQEREKIEAQARVRAAEAAGMIRPNLTPAEFQVALKTEGDRLYTTLVEGGMSPADAQAEVQRWSADYAAKYVTQASAYIQREVAIQAKATSAVPNSTGREITMQPSEQDGTYYTPVQLTPEQIAQAQASAQASSKLPYILGGLAVVGLLIVLTRR